MQSATGSVTITINPIPTSDLSITKAAEPATMVPGDPITYMITLGNAGPLDVIGARVQDLLPTALTGATWECLPDLTAACTASGSGDIDDLADLPMGTQVVYTLTAVVDSGLIGQLSNTATVETPLGITDPNLSNNTSTDISATGAIFSDGFEE